MDVSNKRPLDNGYLPKYKPRRVSAVRDFPPGCGPNAAAAATSNGGGGGGAGADKCRSGEVVNNAVDVDMTESLDALVGKIVVSANVNGKPAGIQLPDEAAKAPAEPLVVGQETSSRVLNESARFDWVKGVSSVKPKDKYRMRRVSAVRDFPPNCVEAVQKVEAAPEESLSKHVPENGTIEEAAVEKGIMVVYSGDVNDKDGLVAVDTRHESDGIGPSTCGEEKYLEITPISMACPNTSDSDSDSDSPEPGLNDVVVYSTSGVERKLVHALMASGSPDAESSRGKSKKQDSSPRTKGKAIAKKSVLKPKVKISGSAYKKKLKNARIGDANQTSLPLVPSNDEENQLEDSPKESTRSRTTQDVEINLPPFGPNSSGDPRDRVRDTLRVFHAICRKLLQHYEANTKPEEEGEKSRKKAKRFDLDAAKVIKQKGKEVNTGKPILGEVPGVEVGDEFQYRVELAIVGIHRLYQAGIDSMKLENGALVATSIVSSGAYADDLENAGVLIYSGQGGNIVGNKKKQLPEDQKLEKGNLALKNSIDLKTPVRVVRGWKEKALDPNPNETRPKLVMTYVYDGLYTVQRYWTETGAHGIKVFMFELRRNPNQPELAWKELKKSKKTKTREGVCVKDVSGGKERFAISAVNTINDDKPPSFSYTSDMMYPGWHNPVSPEGCDCVGRCSDSRKCKCAVKNDGEIPYNRNGALVETKLLVYECGPHCKCPPACYNRVSQHGIKYQLEVFKTESRGWGVRALTSIPSGSFICEYAGELLEDTEAEKRIGNDEYLFDIGQNLTDSSVKPKDQAISAELVEDGGYTIDACQYGNVGRFINHSCTPNLYAQNVIYDHSDLKMPHIMFFAMENIPPLQELTYHYNYSVDQVRDSDGNIKVKKCYCGTSECTGRLY